MSLPAYKTFVEPLRIHAEAIPDDHAFAFLKGEDEERLSFAELHEQALGLAHQLRDSVEVGDRALLLLAPGLDYVVGVYGCLYAGVIAVPAPPPQARRLERTLERLLSIAEAAGISAVITETQLAETARATIPARHPLRDVQWVAADAVSPSSDERVINQPDPQEVAFLQYTSGSTGDPRGVRVTHLNLLDNSQFIRDSFAHEADQSIGFNWIPPFHDMGLIGALLQPVYCGGLSVLTSPLEVMRRPIRWLQGIDRYRATTSGGPSFAYDMCVKRISAEECEGLDLSCWKVAFNGAEPISAEAMLAFADKFKPNGFHFSAFFPCYGLAESTLMVTATPVDQEPILRRFSQEALSAHRAVPGAEADPLLVGCGTPNEEHRVEIVKPGANELAAPGEIGEIWVSGPSVADGYWEEANQERFQATLSGEDDGPRFLRTGDLGVVSDGNLFVVGRLSDLIILNGRNQHPHDIELFAEAAEPLFISHSTAAFELRFDDDRALVGLVAESRAEDEQAVERALENVRGAIRETLDLPLGLIAVCRRGAVPKTTSGKIQRRLCRSLLLAGDLEVIAEWRLPLPGSTP